NLELAQLLCRSRLAPWRSVRRIALRRWLTWCWDRSMSSSNYGKRYRQASGLPFPDNETEAKHVESVHCTMAGRGFESLRIHRKEARQLPGFVVQRCCETQFQQKQVEQQNRWSAAANYL